MKAMYHIFHACIKSDVWSATTTWKHKFRKNTVPVASRTMECLHSIWNSYDKIIEEHSHWKLTETHIGQMVDGNADHRIRKPIITMMLCIKIVTEAIEKKNMRDQREIKIAILAITAYTSILICLYNTLQNLWCSSRKTIKYVQYLNKIPWTFSY